MAVVATSFFQKMVTFLWEFEVLFKTRGLASRIASPEAESVLGPRQETKLKFTL